MPWWITHAPLPHHNDDDNTSHTTIIVLHSSYACCTQIICDQRHNMTPITMARHASNMAPNITESCDSCVHHGVPFNAIICPSPVSIRSFVTVIHAIHACRMAAAINPELSAKSILQCRHLDYIDVMAASRGSMQQVIAMIRKPLQQMNPR